MMRGVFQSGGQNCVGIERIIAMPKTYRALMNILEQRISKLRLGSDLDPDQAHDEAVDMGAMISGASFERLENLIAEAKAQGARVLAGGHRYQHPRYPHGHYFMPTLIVDVEPSMRIAQEELFAPVCVMMLAKDVEEVISIANSTEYGLGASVFGPTSSTAARQNLARVTSAVKAGMIAVNDFAAYVIAPDLVTIALTDQNLDITLSSSHSAAGRDLAMVVLQVRRVFEVSLTPKVYARISQGGSRRLSRPIWITRCRTKPTSLHGVSWRWDMETLLVEGGRESES